METYNFPHVVPQLVEDNSLKRARTTITEGGEEKDAIRVTSIGGNENLDSQGVADAMGLQASTTAQNSVLDYLASTKSNLATTKTLTASVDNNTFMTRDWLGNKTDVAWSGTGDGTLNAIAKRTSNDVHSIGFSVEAVGTNYDQSVSSSSDGSINGRLKWISSQIDNVLVGDVYNIQNATGTRSDTAWSGSGNGTVIALLKGIYNKL